MLVDPFLIPTRVHFRTPRQVFFGRSYTIWTDALRSGRAAGASDARGLRNHNRDRKHPRTGSIDLAYGGYIDKESVQCTLAPADATQHIDPTTYAQRQHQGAQQHTADWKQGFQIDGTKAEPSELRLGSIYRLIPLSPAGLSWLARGRRSA